MFYLGRTQKLKVVKRLEHGAYLSDEGMSNDESFCDVPENERVEQDTILLPRKEVGLLSLSVGDIVQAFIYKDYIQSFLHSFSIIFSAIDSASIPHNLRRDAISPCSIN